jgi:hypothetical protein
MWKACALSGCMKEFNLDCSPASGDLQCRLLIELALVILRIRRPLQPCHDHDLFAVEG